jgi:hypothetical protein
VDLTRLRVDQVRLELLTVAQQQRVGERAVTPVHATPVELDQQVGHRVEEQLPVASGRVGQAPEQPP